MRYPEHRHRARLLSDLLFPFGLDVNRLTSPKTHQMRQHVQVQEGTVVSRSRGRSAAISPYTPVDI